MYDNSCILSCLLSSSHCCNKTATLYLKMRQYLYTLMMILNLQSFNKSFFEMILSNRRWLYYPDNNL